MDNLKTKIVESPVLFTILLSLMSGLIIWLLSYLPDHFYQWFSVLGYKWLSILLLLLVLALYAQRIYYRHLIKSQLFLYQPKAQKQIISSKNDKRDNLIIAFVASKSNWLTEINEGREAIQIHAQFLITNTNDKENSITTVRIKKYNIALRTSVKLQNMNQSTNIFEVVKPLLPDKTYDFTAEGRIYRKHPVPNKHLYLDFYFEDKFENKYTLKNILFDAQHRRNRPEKAN